MQIFNLKKITWNFLEKIELGCFISEGFFKLIFFREQKLNFFLY